MENWKGKKC